MKLINFLDNPMVDPTERSLDKLTDNLRRQYLHLNTELEDSLINEVYAKLSRTDTLTWSYSNREPDQELDE
jgi:hypothetical protein